ncbi:MAG TPA: prenyltransferase/squalene oxidase repeat-containing protein [Terriglobales bacterium]|nr:prenyltransferase/squalene oxidase repeat-containing protein [Terriglobales bacterium]
MRGASDSLFGLGKLTSFELPKGGVPYYRGGGPAAEPSLLALLAFKTAPGPVAGMEALLAWVSTLQNPDGSVAVNAADRDQGIWLTAPAAVVFERYGMAPARDRALDFLASLSSKTVANDSNVRQDNTIVGWPWVRDTFGWVEPTAWAVLALGVCGRGSHPRAVEGRRFLLDRQIPSGGWNYGNPGVNDRELLPFWDTTGLALLALRERTDVSSVRPSLEFLQTNQEKIRSLCGLAWAVLGLEAWGRAAPRLRERLAAAMAPASDEGLNAAHLAAGVIALSGGRVFAP